MSYQIDYYLKNKESIRKKQKEYRVKNAKKLNQRYLCDCGGQFVWKQKFVHCHSERHIRYMNRFIVYLEKKNIVKRYANICN
jgi:hypothetical protein